MSDDDKEFVIPQEEADKMKSAAYQGSKAVFTIIIIIIIGIVGFAVYWTQFAGNEFPVTVDVNVEESGD